MQEGKKLDYHPDRSGSKNVPFTLTAGNVNYLSYVFLAQVYKN